MEQPFNGIYEINQDRSYCYTTNKEQHDTVDLYTNDAGEHIIGN